MPETVTVTVTEIDALQKVVQALQDLEEALNAYQPGKWVSLDLRMNEVTTMKDPERKYVYSISLVETRHKIIYPTKVGYGGYSPYE